MRQTHTDLATDDQEGMSAEAEAEAIRLVTAFQDYLIRHEHPVDREAMFILLAELFLCAHTRRHGYRSEQETLVYWYAHLAPLCASQYRDRWAEQEDA